MQYSQVALCTSDGAWLINQVVDAVTKGASYNDTVLMISYDEEGLSSRKALWRDVKR